MRKRLLISLFLAAMICVGSVALRFFSATDAISRDTYDRVQPGMTEEEVMRLISTPDGDKNLPDDLIPFVVAADGKGHFVAKEVTTKPGDDGSTHYFDRDTGKLVGSYRKWEDGHHRLAVLFDADKRVRGRTLYKLVRDKPVITYHVEKINLPLSK